MPPGAKLSSPASQLIGMAALANSAGALISITATSWSGLRVQSRLAPLRMERGWGEYFQPPSGVCSR